MKIKLSDLHENTLYKAQLDRNGESIYIVVTKLFKNGRIGFSTVNHGNDKGFCMEKIRTGPVTFNKLFNLIEKVAL